jgi:hypothetical protein
VSQASGAKILLLVVDPAEKAAEAKQGAPAGEAA